MDHLLKTTPEEKRKIREFYNLTEAQVVENVEIIKTWKAKQPHLPLNISDDFIENILIRNKFQTERTKEKLDNYFSIRGSNRDFIENLQSVVPSTEATIHLPSVRLTPKFERLTIWKILDTDPDHFDFNQMIKAQIAIDEMLLKYDYSIGTRYFIDTSGLSFKHYLKINPILVTKTLWFEEKVYSRRILGIHLINLPSFANKLMALMKVCLKPKIYNRIMTHENLDSVYEFVPKECLPTEYGGTAGDISDLLKKWDDALKTQRDFFVENYDNVSREELRPAETRKDDGFGVDGTFKKLNID